MQLPGQLNGQMGALSDQLTQVVNGLRAIEIAINSQSEQREDEIVCSTFAYYGPPFVTPMQVRIAALVVYTATAGLWAFQRGNDASLQFLSTVNGRVEVVSGDLQRIVIPRGMPLTFVPPAAPDAWYAQVFWRAGTTQGRQS